MTIKQVGKIVALLLLISLSAHSQQSKVGFVNSGPMYVGENGGTSLYIPAGMRAVTNSNISQEGTTSLGGDFFQDSWGHAFTVDALGRPSGSGKVRFFSPAGDLETHYISSSDTLAFDREMYYIAFPGIEVATTGNLVLPATMGIDATSLTRSGQGKLWLRSGELAGKVMNASLRLYGTAQPAAAVVEQYVNNYRTTTGASPLFGFASPFTNMENAYFVGNFIRRTIANNNGHVVYPYGNTPDPAKPGYISLAQYLKNVGDTFTPGEGYLVELRSRDFDYSTLWTGTSIGLHESAVRTESLYHIDRFIFHGTTSLVNGFDEESNLQLFSGNISRTTPGATGSTLNWIIGNSYTAPIGIQELITAMNTSGLTYSPVIYVYQPNSGYVPYNISGSTATTTQPVQLIELEEIPSMSVFMVRVSNINSQAGTLNIGRDLLTHSITGHNFLRTTGNYQNEVLLHVSPDDEPRIYDLAATGFRQGAQEGSDELDMSKIPLSGDLAQLYFLTPTGSKLSSSALPYGLEKTTLAFYPGKSRRSYTLTATRTESLTTEGLWLEDTKKGITADLLSNGGTYRFEGEGTDELKRFVLHFSNPGGNTGINCEAIEGGKLQAWYEHNALIVNNLRETDLYSKVEVYDLQGRKIDQRMIDKYPQMRMEILLDEGIYIARVNGTRNVLLKFKK